MWRNFSESMEKALPLAPNEKIAQLYARLKLPYEVYRNRPMAEWEHYDRMEFGQHLRRLLPAEIACRLDVRILATESEANIENHLSNLDSHFRPAPRATQVMVESLPFSMRKHKMKSAIKITHNATSCSIKSNQTFMHSQIITKKS